MLFIVNFVIVLAAVVAMEVFTWWAHKYIMHGWGWRWHRSHHIPAASGFQDNDWYALVPTLISIVLFCVDDSSFGPLFWIALGMVLYGVLYVFVHEALAHGRWPLGWQPRRGYLRRLVQAHRLHHAVDTRDGGVSFGFLYAPPARHLAKELRARRRQA
jgi:beta-carotene 3-hydroxylase